MGIISSWILSEDERDRPHGRLLGPGDPDVHDNTAHNAVRVVGLNCTHKLSGEPSNTQVLLSDIVREMLRYGDVYYDAIRVTDHDIRPRGASEHVDGRAAITPHIAAKVQAADVLLLGTPIWGGYPSSIAQLMIDLMQEWSRTTDERGQRHMYGKSAGVALIGSAHDGSHVHADIGMALNDLGFTIPPECRVYRACSSDQAPGTSHVEPGGDPRAETSVEIEHMAHNLMVFATLLRRHSIPAIAREHRLLVGR